jgi:hypothetical protein
MFRLIALKSVVGTANPAHAISTFLGVMDSFRAAFKVSFALSFLRLIFAWRHVIAWGLLVRVPQHFLGAFARPFEFPFRALLAPFFDPPDEPLADEIGHFSPCAV